MERLCQDIPVFEYRLQSLGIQHFCNFMHFAAIRDFKLRGSAFKGMPAYLGGYSCGHFSDAEMDQMIAQSCRFPRGQ